MLAFLQTQHEISIQILWLTFLILLVFTLVLLLGSMYMRWRHRVIDRKVEHYTSYFYPIVLEYLETGGKEDEMLKHFTGKKIEYAVFEKVVIDLVNQLQGEDANKIRQLLFIDPIFEHHVKQLDSRSDIAKVKACNYFSYIRLVNFKVIQKLRHMVRAENRLLAFSAASALMGSRKIEHREYALFTLAKRKRITEMALLELLFKFQYQHDDQRDAEAKSLRKIILSADVPSDNVALLILGASEIGYFQLRELFYKLLISKERKWNISVIKVALIRAQGYFFNDEAAPYLRKMMDSRKIKVLKPTAEVLSTFGGEENDQVLFEKIQGRNEDLDFTIMSAMVRSGYDMKTITENANTKNKAYLDTLVEILRHEPEMNQ